MWTTKREGDLMDLVMIFQVVFLVIVVAVGLGGFIYAVRKDDNK